MKTKNNQNCQKTELYKSLTTKELKKKHSSRQVGGVETGSGGREELWQGSDWWTGRPHISMQIKLGVTTGEQDIPSNPGF